MINTKKIIAGVVLSSLLLPSLAFAAQPTTASNAAYIASLEQILTLLEKELAAILAQPATTSTTVPQTATVASTTATVQVTVGAYQVWKSISGISSNISVTVSNNTSSSIYVPATLNYVPTSGATSNIPGIAYTIISDGQEKAYQGTGAGTVSCNSQIELPIQGSAGYVQACVIAAGQSVQIGISPAIAPAFTNQGEFAVSLTSLSYATTSTNPAFTILPIPTNQSSTYVAI